MLLNFFNDVLNTLVRNLDMKVRIIISFIFAFLAIYCLVFSIRKKNDKAPLSLGLPIFRN